MQIGSRNSSPHNLDLHTAIAISYPAVLSSYILNMYSTQRLEVPSKVPMDRMYSMDSTLNGDHKMPHMPSPKKENMFQSMFNAFNIIWEHFSRVPGTFIANSNNPLSVTVVHNEGIISHEFFKSLTNRKEPLTTDNMYIHNMQRKESLGIVEKICTFDEKSSYTINFLDESMNEDFKSVNMGNGVKCNEPIDRSDIEEFILKRYMGDIIGQDKLKVTVSECNSLSSYNNKDRESGKALDNTSSKNIANATHQAKDFFNAVDMEDMSNNSSLGNKQISDCTDNTAGNTSGTLSQPSDAEQLKNPARQTLITNLFTNMWQKVVGVTDRLYLSMESVDADLSVKRSVSPKQRRKLNTVAKGRGRGRARSQLRRSGVSQTRHRKERSKHDLEIDIQDDLESYQESEIYHDVQENRTVDSFEFADEGVDVPDAATPSIQEKQNRPTFTLADVKPRNCKQKMRKIPNQDVRKIHTRVRYVPDCPMDFDQDYIDNNFDLPKSTFRPRLISESSVDSEDSYCIVFETDSDVNYKSDSDFHEEVDDEQSSDDDEATSSMQKVKFNLKPVVHVMVQWDYAYRAARRGPWEEMARDRERFRGRINCIERVLNPILTIQHRSHIWKERFAFEE